MNCEECRERRMQTVPFIAFEAECARHDRAVKRLVLVIVIIVALLVVSNLAWLYCWNQYDYITEDIGNDGDINYGNYTSETQNP